MADTVNSQITDAVTQSNTNVLGGAPAQSMGLVYQTTAHSISLIMQNAAAAQNSMQQVNAAVISTACRQIMAVPVQIESELTSKKKRPQKKLDDDGRLRPGPDPDQGPSDLSDSENDQDLIPDTSENEEDDDEEEEDDDE